MINSFLIVNTANEIFVTIISVNIFRTGLYKKIDYKFASITKMDGMREVLTNENGKFADYSEQFETSMKMIAFQQDSETFVGLAPGQLQAKTFS